MQINSASATSQMWISPKSPKFPKLQGMCAPSLTGFHETLSLSLMWRQSLYHTISGQRTRKIWQLMYIDVLWFAFVYLLPLVWGPQTPLCKPVVYRIHSEMWEGLTFYYLGVTIESKLSISSRYSHSCYRHEKSFVVLNSLKLSKNGPLIDDMHKKMLTVSVSRVTVGDF